MKVNLPRYEKRGRLCLSLGTSDYLRTVGVTSVLAHCTVIHSGVGTCKKCEAVLTKIDNLCFGTKIRKMNTLIYPIYTIYMLGLRRYLLQRQVSLRDGLYFFVPSPSGKTCLNYTMSK